MSKTNIMDALTQLEKEKNIDKEKIVEAILKSVDSACEKVFGKNADNEKNFQVEMNRETGDIKVFAKKIIVNEIIDKNTDILLDDARHIDPDCQVGDDILVEITTKDFGRIATQTARSIIVQAIKESERSALYDYLANKQKNIVTGVVKGYFGNDLNISLDDKTETILNEKEMIPGEYYEVGDHIKLYVVDVKQTAKGGIKLIVSRTHPDFVKKLFEQEVTEIADGVVEIKSVSREAGSRSKIAVHSNDSNVDPVGACVGPKGGRVDIVVNYLNGEKVDIVNWEEDPCKYVANALSPSKVTFVKQTSAKEVLAVVPDNQLSLAIGNKGQNVRLAARLTGYKIDIKSESIAAANGITADDYNEFEEEIDLSDDSIDTEE